MVRSASDSLEEIARVGAEAARLMIGPTGKNEKAALLKEVNGSLTTLARELKEHPEVYTHLGSLHCNPKSIYWDLPAFLAPRIGALSAQLRQTTESLGGWLFLEDLRGSEPGNVILNLVRVAALLEQFHCRLALHWAICTEEARCQLLDQLKRTDLVPGPARSLDDQLLAWFGRPVPHRALAALLEQTMSPGSTLEVDKSILILSLDRKAHLTDQVLALMRLWKGPLSVPELHARMARVEDLQCSEYDLELELLHLKSEGKITQQGSFFSLPGERPPLVPTAQAADLPNLIFQSLFKICTADDIVAPSEIAAVRNLMAVEFELTDQEREPFESLLNVSLTQSLSHKELGEKLSRQRILSVNLDLRNRLLRAAAAVVVVDYEVHRRERSALQELADELQTTLKPESVVARFEEISLKDPNLVELAYFGVLPDVADPSRLAPKLLKAHDHYLHQLKAVRSPALRQDAQKLQQLLLDFHHSHPFAEPPWLLNVDFEHPSIPDGAWMPLHCLLRVAWADNELTAAEQDMISVLVAEMLEDDGQRALWNLHHPDLTAPLPPLRQQMLDEPLEFRQLCLACAVAVALSDGPVNLGEGRELLNLATELGLQDDYFRTLHVFEQTSLERLQADPDVRRPEDLTAAFRDAIRRLPPIPAVVATAPLPPPPVQLAEGENTYQLVIRPNGKTSFTVHVRLRPEIADDPDWQQRLHDFIESTKYLREGCQGRSWFICKSPAACLEVLAEVRDHLFEVIWPAGQPFQVLGPAGVHNLSAFIRQKQGWFEIGGRLQIGQVGGIDLMDLVARVRAGGEHLALGPDTYISLDGQLRQALRQLEALLPENLGDGKLDPIRARLLAEQSTLFQDETPNQEFTRLATLLEEARDLQPNLNEELWSTLRDYQKEGVTWIVRTTHAGLGACLADDMGLGKTLQTLCVLYHCRRQGASLVVAPTSVTYNWKEQAERFAPELRVLLYEGTAPVRQAWIDRIDEFDLLVMSYGVMQKDIFLLKERNWNCIVLDEAQKIKNPASATARAAYELQSRARLATTGTPIENHLLELWSLMNFLNPGLLGSENAFRQQYLSRATPGGPRGSAEEEDPAQSLSRLRSQVGHFLLRRRKETVAPQLPPKVVTVHRIDLTSEEREMYDRIRSEALARKHEDRLSLLSALTRLRQVCCDPGLIEPEWNETSSKLAAALDMLGEVVRDGHQVLVFSQFVSLLKRLAAELSSHGLPYQELYGSTPVEERRQLVEDFQNGGFPIFLISLKAGGTGITLTNADYVLHLDPWWNPAVEDQATDRAHRIGQSQTVNVYRFIARETVEEKVLELHAQKRELAEAVLGQDEVPVVLSLDDLRQLI